MPVVRVGEITMNAQLIDQYYYNNPVFGCFRLKHVESGAGTGKYDIRLFAIDNSGNVMAEIPVQNSDYHPISYQHGETFEGRDVDIQKDIQLDRISKRNGKIYRISELNCKPRKYEHLNEPGKVLAKFMVQFKRNSQPDLTDFRGAGLFKKIVKAIEISIWYMIEIVGILFSILSNIRFANPSPPASSGENTWSFN